MAKPFNALPEQLQADIGECVDAYYHGGARLARLVFRSVCEARALVRWEAWALGENIRRRLIELGYLPIV